MKFAGDILVLADDAEVVEAVRAALAGAEATPSVLWCRDLPAAKAQLARVAISVILLDLSRSATGLLEAFQAAFAAARGVPIVVLVHHDHEHLAQEAVERGACDYIQRSRIGSDPFRVSLRRMLERACSVDAQFVERDRAQLTLGAIGDGVISADLHGNVTYLNPAAERMTGWSCSEAKGRPSAEVLRLVDGATREPSPDALANAIRDDATGSLRSDTVLVRRDGVECTIEDSVAPIHDSHGHVAGAVMVFRDVTAERVMELRMSHLAQHDFLTGLPNRLLLNDRINQAIAAARRDGGSVAVLFLDLDGFKHVNDSLGHVVGDMLLQSVARRLCATVRASDTVSRQGGDEFVVLLSEIVDAQIAARQAERILGVLALPHAIDGHELQSNVSIGISVYPDDGMDVDSLVKCADTAMYHAKDGGRDTFRFFKREMNVRAVERQTIEADLRRALRHDEFVLHFQAKTHLESGVMTGVEALVRWQHPTRGLLQPAKFVPIAEDSGLIVPLGQWVLRESCRQAQAWRRAGIQPLTVAVNISATEFRHKEFLAAVRLTLEETKLDPTFLELEVTESVLMQDVAATAVTLAELKALGIGLSIDDFGTGYSSLNYLRQFPIDTLKIDSSFVRDSTTDADAASIVGAVISLGRSLRRKVIAEGVETRDQLAFLRQRQCDEAQGYLFGSPRPADEFATLLSRPPQGVPERTAALSQR